VSGSDGRSINGEVATGNSPRRGITEWTNPRNGVHVVQVHYTADPQKRKPEWKEAVLQGMPRRGFLREYEIRWDVPEGDPVIPEFDSGIHVSDRIRLDPTKRLLRFWDFGFVSPVVGFFQLSEWGQLLGFRELCPFNVPLRQLVPAAQSIARDLVPHDRIFDAGDPAAESQTDLGDAASVLSSEFHITLHCTRPGTEISYSSLRQRMLDRVYIPGRGQEPALLLHPQMRMLIEALSGGYHLSPLPPHKPVKKHPDKDLIDMLRYGNDCVHLLNVEFMDQMKKMAQVDRVW
jgi:hypothetical protein